MAKGKAGWLGKAPAKRLPSARPDPKHPTARQRQVLELLQQRKTVREMMATLGICSHAVLCHVAGLVRKGLAVASAAPGVPYRYRPTAAGLSELGLRCCPRCSGAGVVADLSQSC